MMEYFVRMIAKKPDNPEKEYVSYIERNLRHVSDQEKISRSIESHVSTMKKRVIDQMAREKEEHRRAFFERSLQVLSFLKDNVYSNFPENAEMLYLLAMVLKADPYQGIYLAKGLNLAVWPRGFLGVQVDVGLDGGGEFSFRGPVG